ncbi:MAG: histidine kinase [Caldilineaceae bacterium]
MTQTLFSTNMLADVLPKIWENDPAVGRAKLEELRRANRGALAEMRTLLLELRPAEIANADIQQLLRQLADSSAGRAGINVTWQVEGAPVLSADRKVVIYRTMQEALNNVVKHAGANSVRILLRAAHGTTELVVADDGHGFTHDHITSDHLGLKMMRERIETSGGTLHIESRTDEGTEIHAVWTRP